MSDHFADRLNAAVRRVGNPILAGIDPRADQLPDGLLGRYPETLAGVASAFEAFGRGVAEALAGVVPAVKLQSAFYEAYGAPGVAALNATAAHARGLGLIVIIDGKRNDIGSTAEAYATAYLGRSRVGNTTQAAWEADALTINPYLGLDGIAPFAEVAAAEGKGLYVLVRTSNPSAGDFQDLKADGKTIYRHVADRLNMLGDKYLSPSGESLIGAVVGATYPHQLVELRAAMPRAPLLIPGYGAQGGTAADVRPAFHADGLGALVNNSRGLTFAYRNAGAREAHGEDWQAAIVAAARAMALDLSIEVAGS